MTKRRFFRNNKGLSLVEMLISGGMLLLLSTIFFSSVLPALGREKWFQDKQTNISGYLIARERLIALLPPTLLVKVADRTVVPLPNILLLEFYKPDEVQTDSFSNLAIIDLRESVVFDKSVRYQILLTSDGKLVETDDAGSYRKLIWNLGEGAVVTATQTPDLRRVDFDLNGILEPQRDRQVHWQRDMTIRIR